MEQVTKNLTQTFERRAVIDIGTNAVKLLVADVAGTAFPLLKLSQLTRLGHDVFRTGSLQPDTVARTAEAVAEFAVQAAELDPPSVRVLGTRALCEARNRDELIRAIRDATGLAVEILSATQEAEYVFRGVTSTLPFAPGPVLVLDVGGGHTDWLLGEPGSLSFTLSTRLGTIRLLEELSPGDPPTAKDLERCRQAVAECLRHEVHPRLQSVLASLHHREVRLVGLGGALKTLARLSVPRWREKPNDWLRLGLGQATEQIQGLWRLGSLERRRLPGLDPEKAHIILAGAVIYEAVLSQLGFPELHVSRQGLREGALLAGPSCGHATWRRPIPRWQRPGPLAREGHGA